MKHIRTKHSQSAVEIFRKLKNRKLNNAAAVEKETSPINSSPATGVDLNSFVAENSGHHGCPFCSFRSRFKKSLLQHLRWKHPSEEEAKVRQNFGGLKERDLKKGGKLFCLYCSFDTWKKRILVSRP
jgi:hypothetical protein